MEDTKNNQERGSMMELRKGKFWGRNEWSIEIGNAIYTGLTKNELIEKLAEEIMRLK